MTRRLAILGLALPVLGLALLAPQRAEALNPNHQCGYCHDLHGGWSSPLLANTDPESVCLSCHGPGSPSPPIGSSIKVDVHQSKSRSSFFPFRITCISCHDAHSERANWLGAHADPNNGGVWTEGMNIKLLGFRAPSGTVDMWGAVPSGTAVVEALEYDGATDPTNCTYPVNKNNPQPTNYCYSTENRRVVFEQRGSDVNGSNVTRHSFADDDEDGNSVWDGVCETCHTQVGHHINYATADGHHDGQTCSLSCHKHDNYFQK